MTNKEQALKLYPDAVCENVRGAWTILSDNKMISFSYVSEDVAWNRVVSLVNYQLIRKFGQ